MNVPGKFKMMLFTINLVEVGGTTGAVRAVINMFVCLVPGPQEDLRKIFASFRTRRSVRRCLCACARLY